MEKIWGKIKSLSNQNISQLEEMYKLKIPHGQVVSFELVTKIKELTLQLNKEIAVYIDRKGIIKLVTVGTKDLVKIPQIWFKRGKQGYSGIRCIHTHPNGSSYFSEADISALINLKLDALVVLGIDEKISSSIAYLVPEAGGLTSKYEAKENISVTSLLNIHFYELIVELEKQIDFKGHVIQKGQEKALLVIIHWPEWNHLQIEEVTNELMNLANTAGLGIVDIIIQKRDKKDPAFLIGKGKLNKLALKIQEKQVDCVVFEDALSPSQQNNLINYLGIKVLDRTNLILDIFAQRAKSREGKLQVELAQLNYLLPRLTGQGLSLSRLGGGVGTRGPGETKLETDRRHIRKRIQSLQNELLEVKKHRNVLHNNRLGKSLPLVALVGYTNAGKSSLLNVLAQENVLVEDKLFATLDPTTRIIKVGENHQVLLTDTVGFIRNLPHQLISAFKATLEEVKLADLLLHVIDISNKNIESNIQIVQNVLNELEVLDKSMIYVFNKTDLVEEEPIIPIGNNKYCLVSTKTGWGLENLRFLIKEHFFNTEVKIKLLIPYEKGFWLDQAYQIGTVEIIGYKNTGTEIILTAYQDQVSEELKKFIVME
ncbi:MAG: GTPase [Clostridia bacterium]|jgi:GTP-binding protein HflX|nr:GTPase [Clostridia bacterium]MDN5324255.1 GTPase [Clostridia bacterium]